MRRVYVPSHVYDAHFLFLPTVQQPDVANEEKTLEDIVSQEPPEQ
jgi:hypothetical protein